MASPPAFVPDANAGYWMRRDAPSTPSSRYPEGFSIRVTEARAMRDPKNNKKSIGLYEVCTFTKGCSTFDAYHANNKRWKRFSEFEQLGKLLNDHTGDGDSVPSMPSKHSMRGSRSKVLLEDRRKGLEEYMGGMIKLFYSTKSFKLKLVFVRWMNLHYNESYVQHLNQVQNVDTNTSEYIDPSDADGDKNDSLFGDHKMPKLGMPKLGMPKLGMPKMGMPKFSMPSMPKMPAVGMPGFPSMPKFGDTPEEIEKKRLYELALLAERAENALAFIDALDDKARDLHIIARQCAYIQQNGNGWTYLDSDKNGDDWKFDREQQTATRSITGGGMLSSSSKTEYFWDEPVYISGDIFELKLTEKKSKVGILNWDNADADDIKTVRITLGTSQRRILKFEFMGSSGADFCKGKEKTTTRKQYYDTVPPEPLHAHPLTLFASRYGGSYSCNICSKTGSGPAYSCDECKYDVHPDCRED